MSSSDRDRPLFEVCESTEEILGIGELRSVIEETYDTRHKWDSILSQLDFKDSTIEAIRIECQGKPDACHYKGLSEWLKGEGRTWRDLVEALYAVGLVDTAIQIGMNHGLSIGIRTQDVPSKCTCSVKVAVVLITSLVLGIFICGGLSGYFGHKSRNSHSQEITLYRNTTILVADEPLDGEFTAGIHFELTALKGSAVEICQLDCTGGPAALPTRSIPIMLTKTSTSRFSRRSVVLVPNDHVDTFYDSIYLLGGSIVHFSTEWVGVPIKLYIFLDLKECNDFLREKPFNSSHQNFKFELNETNNYTATMRVSHEDKGSYYCGIWDTPPNLSFQYTITGMKVEYFVNQENAICINPLSPPLPCPNNSNKQVHCFNLEPSVISGDLCVFLSQTNVEYDLAASIRTFSTLNNGYFGSSIGILVFCFAMLLLTVTIILGYCVRSRYKKSTTTLASSYMRMYS